MVYNVKCLIITGKFVAYALFLTVVVRGAVIK